MTSLVFLESKKIVIVTVTERNLELGERAVRGSGSMATVTGFTKG